MLKSLHSLNPISVPINFYHHNPALPLTPNSLTVTEALELIRLTRKELPNADRIMVAGGRELMFGKDQEKIFEAGANSIVIGDYLTTQGRDKNRDLDMIHQLGFEIALSPEDK